MPRKKSNTKPTSPSKQGRAPRGQVGIQTYEQVRKIAESKGIPLVKAFAEVAQATGRQASTVAVTYYRISRQRGGGRRGKLGRGKGLRSSNGRAASFGKTAMSQVSAAIATLQRIIAQQAHEIERLKVESKLADRIRKALKE